MLIEPEAMGMQQHTPQQPVAQVPQITSPNVLGLCTWMSWGNFSRYLWDAAPISTGLRIGYSGER
ncbi:hypothetical protein KSD_91090 [Ktedonobacter sp. SOSP1-85]|nr:hypothetical protein KSD_91090 [Ktedonobacter sp. SOSP1-85]